MRCRSSIGESALPVLLLLGLEDIGGALVAGEQVLAVLGVEEAAERRDAAGDEEEVVIRRAPSPSTASTVMPRALVAEPDLQRSWEGEEIKARTE
jgi:hypothetical protein